MKYCLMSLTESARNELTPPLSQRVDWLFVGLVVLTVAVFWHNYNLQKTSDRKRSQE